jgi:hypothetical protein
MVYMTEEELGWRPYVQTWINTQFAENEAMNDELKEHLWNNFRDTIDPGLEWLREYGSEPIKTTNLQ